MTHKNQLLGKNSAYNKAATTSTIRPPCGESIGQLAMAPATATAEANDLRETNMGSAFDGVPGSYPKKKRVTLLSALLFTHFP